MSARIQFRKENKMSPLTISRKRRKQFIRSFGIAAIASAMSFAGGAHAAPILSDITVSGNLALGIAANGVSLGAPGTVSLPPPNDFGTGTLTAVAGSIPSVSLVVDSHQFQGTGGGGGSVTMTYHMMYFNPAATLGSTIDATIHTDNVLTQSGGSTAKTTLTVGNVYSAFECLSSNGPLSSCGTPPLHQGAPFSSGPITLVQNLDYTVFLQVSVSAAEGAASAFVDPWFSAPAGDGGQFIFSPGITAFDDSPVGVPGPIAGAGLPGVLAGFGAMLAWYRKRRAIAA
jgi:hypothetical protein